MNQYYPQQPEDPNTQPDPNMPTKIDKKGKKISKPDKTEEKPIPKSNLPSTSIKC